MGFDIKKKLNTYLWTKYLVLIFLFVNISVVLINYIIDPYQQYRRATLYTFTVQDQRYLNAGLAKNYDYDSIVVGSSMTENFYSNDVNNILHFKKTIKLPFQGSSIFEEVALMKTAFRYKNVKNILFGLDIYSFSGETIPLSKSSFFPQYLYDKNVFNDLSYVLNFKILKKSFKSLNKPYNKHKVNKELNSIYNWQKLWQKSFNVDNVLSLYNKRIVDFNTKSKQEKNKTIKNFRLNILQKNFDTQLLPILQAHPEIHFYIFYPPYSILSYKTMLNESIIYDIIDFKKHIFNTLQSYNNIKIYDFQIADEVVKNLHNYKDVNHYNEDINKWILKQIAKGNYLVTKNNIEEYSNKLLNDAKTYKVIDNDI